MEFQFANSESFHRRQDEDVILSIRLKTGVEHLTTAPAASQRYMGDAENLPVQVRELGRLFECAVGYPSWRSYPAWCSLCRPRALGILMLTKGVQWSTT